MMKEVEDLTPDLIGKVIEFELTKREMPNSEALNEGTRIKGAGTLTAYSMVRDHVLLWVDGYGMVKSEASKQQLIVRVPAHRLESLAKNNHFVLDAEEVDA